MKEAQTPGRGTIALRGFPERDRSSGHVVTDDRSIGSTGLVSRFVRNSFCLVHDDDDGSAKLYDDACKPRILPLNAKGHE